MRVQALSFFTAAINFSLFIHSLLLLELISYHVSFQLMKEFINSQCRFMKASRHYSVFILTGLLTTAQAQLNFLGRCLSYSLLTAIIIQQSSLHQSLLHYNWVFLHCNQNYKIKYYPLVYQSTFSIQSAPHQKKCVSFSK